MKITKLLILSTFILNSLISFAFANRINILDIEWRKFDINIENINSKLKELQNKYALNVDIAVIGKDKEECYKDYYFPSCVKEKYNYAWDILFTIKKKLSESDSGDLETLRNDEFYFLIDTYTINQIQEDSIAFFRVEDLNAGIKTYLDNLDEELSLSCKYIYEDYEEIYKAISNENKWEKLKKSCNVFDLEKIYNKAIILNEDLEKQKSKETTKKIITYIVIWISLIFGIYFLYIKIQTSRYSNKLKNMLKDIKFYKMELKNKDSFFPDIKKELNNDILSIENRLERYLWDMDKNRKILKTEYETFSIDKEILSKKREKAIYDYTHQENLKKNIEEFKKRDL